jgi:hypothetical protein
MSAYRRSERGFLFPDKLHEAHRFSQYSPWRNPNAGGTSPPGSIRCESPQRGQLRAAHIDPACAVGFLEWIVPQVVRQSTTPRLSRSLPSYNR